MKIKTLLAGVAGALALATTAFAADLPSRSAAPAPYFASAPEAFSWNGFYAGVNAGYSNGKAKGSVEGYDLGVESKPTGFTLGGFAGYNVQLGNVVVGAEADAEYVNAKKTTTVSDYDVYVRNSRDWQGSLRARVGYAFDRLLPYVTGGVAVARINNTLGAVGYGDAYSFADTRYGWTVGAGADYALTNHMFVRAEYRYTDFGDKTFNVEGANLKLSQKDNAFKVGVGYKF